YPYYLKNRIRGGKGHLSNKQALALFKLHKSPFLSHLFLSHLSQNNNCPQLVEDLFKNHAGDTKIIIASRYAETDVYEIRHLPKTTISLQQNPIAQLELPFA
ncbi:MAG: MBL fold metallo-hydrolase, partial [Flavisolibacter sp.]|nr:MBL fold metallo-hydrolase [Flavisolibacter sp.]